MGTRHWCGTVLTLVLAILCCSAADLIHHYDVVTPTLLHSSDQDGNFPGKMTILLKMEKETLTLDLTKNKGLLRPNFKYRVQEGQREQLYEGKENCYYYGRVKEHPDWSVVISTCFGVRGTFGGYSLQNTTFFIEPLEEKVNGKHMVYRASELPDSHFSGKCGHAGSDGHSNPSLNIPAPPAMNALRRRKRQSNNSTFFLELYVATDTAAYTRRNNNTTRLLHEIVEIVNHMDDIFNTLTAFKVRIALIEMKAYTSSNPITVTRDPSATLSLWKAHFRSNIHQNVPADAGLLFVGDGFNNGILGIAPVGSMCRSTNAGLATLRDSPLASATTAAHDLGDMFGLDHDGADCTCADSECIMSARISTIPTQWSSCSQTMFATEFNNGNYGDLCLADEPNFVNTDNVIPYVCGNGIREPGEGCDCGSVQECDDPCCNATLCSLRQGAKCYSHDPCCRNCQYMPAGVECRSVSGDCDVAEHCTGSSGECPNNLYLKNGINCTASNEQGFCIDGQCLTRTSQCQRIYGDTDARSAPEVCYGYNTVGNCYGKCSIEQPCGSVCRQIPCAQEDVLCGIIRCVTDKVFPVISTPPGTTFATLTCPRGGVTTHLFCLRSFSPELTDPAFVQNFTKCGENKVCINQRCVTADFRASTCASNAAGVECNGQGVCTQQGICACNVGWDGDACDNAQNTTSKDTMQLMIENFQEVTTVNENDRNLVAFSFDVFTGDSNSTSTIMSDDEVYLQWMPVNSSSRGLIKLNFTESDIDGLRQENHTAEGIVRYRFTVNVRDLGEGPLLLTLSIKLQCVHYNDSELSRCFLCTCTQWQYEGESETILLSMKRGPVSIVNLQDITTQNDLENKNAVFAFDIHPRVSPDMRFGYSIQIQWSQLRVEFGNFHGTHTYYLPPEGVRNCGGTPNATLELVTSGSYKLTVPTVMFGSGPLSISVSVSLACLHLTSSYCPVCSQWRYTSQASSIDISAKRGSLAPFEVDLKLWPTEQCFEAANAIKATDVSSALIMTIRDNADDITDTSALQVYSERYLCERKGHLSFRGVLVKLHDSLATKNRDILGNWLKGGARHIVVADRWMNIKEGACGIALTSLEDPACVKRAG